VNAGRLAGASALLVAAACGPTWSDVSRSLSDPPSAAREPVRDRQRTYYDRDTTRPRTDVHVLLYPDGRSLKDGVERRWTADGTLEIEHGWREGRPYGLWRTWFPDGSPRFEHRYDPDEVTAMRWWHRGGAISSEGPARDGLREGLWRGRHPDGAPAFEGGYVAGRRAGPWTFWHSDRSLAERGSYQADVRVGTWESFAPGEWPDAAPAWDEDQ